MAEGRIFFQRAVPGMVSWYSASRPRLFFHPLAEFFFWNHHAGPDFQDRKALAVEQVVCPGLGDPQHLGYKLRIQKQWEIVMGLINW